MSDEILDIVDLQDRVIGSACRSEILQRKLYRRVVDIFVVNARGETLLQKRSVHKSVLPGHWTNAVGGHVLTGEDYGQAARREFAEEIGGASEMEILPICHVNPVEKQSLEHCGLYLVRSEGPFQANPEEVEELEWLTFEQIDSHLAQQSRPFTRSFHILWPIFRRHFP